MSDAPQTDVSRDVEWLRCLLVRLLEQAADDGEPDHAACAKYADLLFKMLPSSGGGPNGRAPAHPDEKAIAAMRLAIQRDGA